MQSAVKSRNPWEIRSKTTESDIQIFTRNRESLSKSKISEKLVRKSQQRFRRNDTETQKAKKKNLRLRLFKERNWSADPAKFRVNPKRINGKIKQVKKVAQPKNFTRKRKKIQHNLE